MITSAYVPVSPVIRPASVNQPPADSYDASDWPKNERPKERTKPTPAISASQLAIWGRGGRCARRGARCGRRPVSKVAFSGLGRVVTSFMVGRYGVTIRGTVRSTWEFVQKATVSVERREGESTFVTSSTTCRSWAGWRTS